MRRAALMMAALSLLFAVPSVASAQEHTVQPRIPIPENSPGSGELVESADLFDGSTVVFRGEAIGEAMVRGHWTWLHVNDDSYMERNIEEGAPLGGLNTGMPVWSPSSEAEKVTIFGDYRHEGDVIEVRGTFNASCPQHGGDMDIHAVRLTVVRPGREVDDPVSAAKLSWAIVAALVAGGAFVLDRNLEKIREPRYSARP